MTEDTSAVATAPPAVEDVGMTDIVQYGLSTFQPPEKIADALQKWRGDTIEYGRTQQADNPEKFWNGVARLDADIATQLDGLRVTAIADVIRTDLDFTTNEDVADFLNRAQGGGELSPTEQDALAKIRSISDNPALKHNANLSYGNTIEVGGAPLARYSLRDGGKGKVDAMVLFDADTSGKAALIQLDDITADGLKKRIDEKKESIAGLKERIAGLAEDQKVSASIPDVGGGSAGATLGLNERMKYAQGELAKAQSELAGLQSRDGRKFALELDLQEKLKQPEYLDRMGDKNLAEDFERGLKKVTISTAIGVIRAHNKAGIFGDQESAAVIDRFRAALNETDVAIPGSTQRKFVGGLWNESLVHGVEAIGQMAPTVLSTGGLSRLLSSGGTGAFAPSAAMAPSAFGQTYAQTLDMADSIEFAGNKELAKQLRSIADIRAAMQAVTEVGTEMMGGGHAPFATRGGAAGLLNFAKRYPGQVLGEAGEEIAAGGIQRGITDRATMQGTAEGNMPITKGMLEEAGAGLVAAVPIAGAGVLPAAFGQRQPGGVAPEAPPPPAGPERDVGGDAAAGAAAATAPPPEPQTPPPSEPVEEPEPEPGTAESFGNLRAAPSVAGNPAQMAQESLLLVEGANNGLLLLGGPEANEQAAVDNSLKLAAAQDTAKAEDPTLQPESLDTLAWQIDAMVDPAKPKSAVLFEGLQASQINESGINEAVAAAKIKHGTDDFEWHVIDTDAGAVLYNSLIHDEEEILQKANEDRLGIELGYGVASKPPAMRRANIAATKAAVTAGDPITLEQVQDAKLVTLTGQNGMEKASVVVASDQVPAAKAALNALADPYDVLNTTPAQDAGNAVIGEREQHRGRLIEALRHKAETISTKPAATTWEEAKTTEEALPLLEKAMALATDEKAAAVASGNQTAIASADKKINALTAAKASLEKMAATGGEPTQKRTWTPPNLPPRDPSMPPDILDYLAKDPILYVPKDKRQAGTGEFDWMEKTPIPYWWRQFVFGRSGRPIDVVANSAFEQVDETGAPRQLIKDTSPDSLVEAIHEAIKRRQAFKQSGSAESQEEARLAEAEQQTIAFEKATEDGPVTISPDDLATGDTMIIEGERAVVTGVDFDEDGYVTAVTIKDGAKFGIQKISGTRELKVESLQKAERKSVDFPTTATVKEEPATPTADDVIGKQKPKSANDVLAYLNAKNNNRLMIHRPSGGRGVGVSYTDIMDRDDINRRFTLPDDYKKMTLAELAKLLPPKLEQQDMLAGTKEDQFNLISETKEEREAREKREDAERKKKEAEEKERARAEAEKNQGKLFDQADELPKPGSTVTITLTREKADVGKKFSGRIPDKFAQNAEPSPGGLSEAEVWQQAKQAAQEKRAEIIAEFRDAVDEQMQKAVEEFGPFPKESDLYIDDDGYRQFQNLGWGGHSISRHRDRDENDTLEEWTPWGLYGPDDFRPSETFQKLNEALETLRSTVLDSKQWEIESGGNRVADETRLLATYDVIRAIAVPPGWDLENAQDSSYGSKYWHVTGAPVPGSNPEDPLRQTYKISIRSHEPSPLREAQFGAVDYFVPLHWEKGNAIETTDLKDLSEAMERLEEWMWRTHLRAQKSQSTGSTAIEDVAKPQGIASQGAKKTGNSIPPQPPPAVNPESSGAASVFHDPKMPFIKAIVHRSAQKKGKWQATILGPNGPAQHFEAETQQEAESILLESGFVAGSGAFDRAKNGDESAFDELDKQKRANLGSPPTGKPGQDAPPRFFSSDDFAKFVDRVFAIKDFDTFLEGVKAADKSIYVPVLKRLFAAEKAGDAEAGEKAEWFRHVFAATRPANAAPPKAKQTPPPTQSPPRTGASPRGTTAGTGAGTGTSSTPPPPPKPPRPPKEAQWNIPSIVYLMNKILGGNIAVGLQMRRRLRGYFQPDKKAVRVNRTLFLDPVQAAKTIAHEVGHFLDLIGTALNDRYLTQKLAPLGQWDKIFGPLWNWAKKNPDGKSKYNFTPIEKILFDETVALSKEWRGDFDEKTDRYRANPKELFADFISATMNDPEWTFDVAPNMSYYFFRGLEQKPELKTAWVFVQDLLRGDTLADVLRGDRKAATDKAIENMLSAGYDSRFKREERFHFAQRIQRWLYGNFINRVGPVAMKATTGAKDGISKAIAKVPGAKFLVQYFPSMWNRVVRESGSYGFVNEAELNSTFANRRNAWVNEELRTKVYQRLLASGVPSDMLGDYLQFNRIINDTTWTANHYRKNPDLFRTFLKWLIREADLQNFTLSSGKGVSFDLSDAAIDAIPDANLMDRGAAIFRAISEQMSAEVWDEINKAAQRKSAPPFASEAMFMFNVSSYQANPQGYTKADSESAMERMERELGPERWAVLQTAADNFYEVTSQIVREARTLGLFKDKLWHERIEPNLKTYAPWAVLDYFTGHVNPGASKQKVGTFKEVLRPDLAYQLKLAALIHRMQKQKSTRTLMKFFTEVGAMFGFANEMVIHDDLKQSEIESLKKRGFAVRGFWDKGTYRHAVFEDGVAVSYMDALDPDDITPLMDVALANYRVWYNMLVGVFAPTFQVVRNPLRQIRTTKNETGVRSGLKLLWEILDGWSYPLRNKIMQIAKRDPSYNLPTASLAVMWANAVMGAEWTPALKAAVDAGRLQPPDPSQIGMLTPEQFRQAVMNGLVSVTAIGTPIEMNLTNGLVRFLRQSLGPVSWLLDSYFKGITYLGAVVEAGAKARTIKHYEEINAAHTKLGLTAPYDADWITQQARMSGITNPGVSARGNTALETIFMFPRIHIQNLRRMRNKALNPKTLGGYILRTFLDTVPLKLFYALAAAGVIDGLIEKLMGGGDDEEKGVDWKEWTLRASPYKIEKDDQVFTGWISDKDDGPLAETAFANIPVIGQIIKRWHPPFGHSSIPENWTALTARLPFSEEGRFYMAGGSFTLMNSVVKGGTPLAIRPEERLSKFIDLTAEALMPGVIPSWKYAGYMMALNNEDPPIDSYRNRPIAEPSDWAVGGEMSRGGAIAMMDDLIGPDFANAANRLALVAKEAGREIGVPWMRGQKKNAPNLPPALRVLQELPVMSSLVALDNYQGVRDMRTEQTDSKRVEYMADTMKGPTTEKAAARMTLLQEKGAAGKDVSGAVTGRTKGEEAEYSVLRQWYNAYYQGTRNAPGLYDVMKSYAEMEAAKNEEWIAKLQPEADHAANLLEEKAIEAMRMATEARHSEELPSRRRPADSKEFFKEYPMFGDYLRAVEKAPKASKGRAPSLFKSAF